MSKKDEMTEEQRRAAEASFRNGIEDVEEADIEYAARKGQSKLARLEGKLPKPLKKLWGDIKTMVSLITDYYKGTYRDISWKSLAAAVGAVLYFVAPLDVIPDFILGWGYIDDATVITLALRMMGGDLDKYRAWQAKTWQRSSS